MMQGRRGAHGLPRLWYLIPTTVLLLGVLSAVLLIWLYRIVERQKLTTEHVDALMDIQARTSTFHLWLEESLTAGTKEEIERTFIDLESAFQLSGALTKGGESEHGTPLTRFADPAFLKEAETIHARLAQLREIALQRAQDPRAGGIGSNLDERFDDVFRDVQRRARNLELVAELQQVRDQARTRGILTVVLPLWIGLMTASIGGVYGWELRRRRAELALERAYADMEQRVQDRTAELSHANDSLRTEIKERKCSEASLLQSERELRRLTLQFDTLLDAIPDRITLVSRKLQVVWANKGALPVGGTESNAGACCHELWRNAATPCTACPALRSFHSGKAEEARITGADGRIWDLRAFPMREETGRIENVIEIGTDVTEKVALQTEAQRAAHLASIGELAAGVAHEINNPINGVINYARILVNESSAGSEVREIAERIVKEGRRIAGIVQGLLSFARQRTEEKRLIPVGDILRDSLTLVGSQMQKEGILIQTEIPPELPGIFVNQQQIQQVFMNLLSNARHALNLRYPGGDPGKLLEITGRSLAPEAEAVRITFSDHGGGIPPEFIDRIMHPFFTTKGPGEGTGLGLSISHGIVADHGGLITVQSVHGESTTVSIDLPTEDRHG